MNKLKIPENHSGISKTLRLPENVVDDVPLVIPSLTAQATASA